MGIDMVMGLVVMIGVVGVDYHVSSLWAGASAMVIEWKVGEGYEKW